MPPKALLLSILVSPALKSLHGVHLSSAEKKQKRGKASDPNLRELPTQEDWGGGAEEWRDSCLEAECKAKD